MVSFAFAVGIVWIPTGYCAGQVLNAANLCVDKHRLHRCDPQETFVLRYLDYTKSDT